MTLSAIARHRRAIAIKAEHHARAGIPARVLSTSLCWPSRSGQHNLHSPLSIFPIGQLLTALDQPPSVGSHPACRPRRRGPPPMWLICLPRGGGDRPGSSRAPAPVACRLFFASSSCSRCITPSISLVRWRHPSSIGPVAAPTLSPRSPADTPLRGGWRSASRSVWSFATSRPPRTRSPTPSPERSSGPPPAATAVTSSHS